MNQRSIWDVPFTELEEWCERRELPGYRPRQIFNWLYNKGASSWDQMTDLPKDLRDGLAESFDLSLPTTVDRVTDSQDSTEKFLIELNDGRKIETVAIPRSKGKERSQKGFTLCVSVQVGCSFACRFCATGRMGLVRNLDAGEIIAQIVLAQRAGFDIKRIVLMGMGEPLHNYENVMNAVTLLTHKAGLDWSPRRITLSTVGLVPEIYRLAQDKPGLKLAVSLHGTTDQKRAEQIPLAKVYTLDRLFDAIEYYQKHENRRISFEYLLIRGVNDGLRDAKRLAERLRELLCHVNLIPYNQVARSDFARPSNKVVTRFAEILREAGVETTIRASRGRGISGACGQLATESKAKRNQ